MGEIEKFVTVLKEFAGIKKKEFLGDLTVLGSVKYYFIMAIGACLDICYHITAKERWGSPDNYSNCIRLLKENNVFDEEFSKLLVSMVKFRFLLLHHAQKIDDEKVYGFLQTELGNFQIYIDLISKKYL